VMMPRCLPLSLATHDRRQRARNFPDRGQSAPAGDGGGASLLLPLKTSLLRTRTAPLPCSDLPWPTVCSGPSKTFHQPLAVSVKAPFCDGYHIVKVKPAIGTSCIEAGGKETICSSDPRLPPATKERGLPRRHVLICGSAAGPGEPKPPWQRRTNVWRKAISPAPRAGRLKSRYANEPRGNHG
jgi:hypothetical protein